METRVGVVGVPVKKALPSLVSDKRKTGYGVLWTAEKKKSRALAGATIEPGHVGTHVPCLVHTHVHAGVYACPGLFLPSWGDTRKRGRGRIVSVCKKKATEYKCMGLCRGVLVPGGKNREMGATPSSVDR